VFRRLGRPAFVQAMLGTDEHSGFVAFIPRNVRSATTYTVAVPPGNAAAKIGISSPRLGIVASKIVGAVDLPFELTEDGLIVDMRKLRPVVEQKAFAESVLLKREHMVAAE
jgi:hypothetical protein